MRASLVRERYKVIEEIGGGAWSTVYRVLDRARGEVQLALKRVSMTAPPRAVDSLRAEYRFLASCRHRHLVPVFDFGLDPAPFFTMELMDDEEIRNQPRDRVVPLLLDLLDVLVFIHSRGMVHFDVKPVHVRLCPSGHLKLLDLGLAGAPGRLSNPRGSIGYIAPEVYHGDAVDGRADLYSLGIVAFEWLAGRHPFAGETDQEIIERQLHCSPDATALTQFPRTLVTFVMQLLAKSPDQRFANAESARLALLNAAPAALHPTRRARARPPLDANFARPPFIASSAAANLAIAHLGQAGSVPPERGVSLILSGPTGMGKTRILQELRIEGQVQGAHVIDASGDDPTGFIRHLLLSVPSPRVLPEPPPLSIHSGVTASSQAPERLPGDAQSALNSHGPELFHGADATLGHGSDAALQWLLHGLRVLLRQGPVFLLIDNLEEVDTSGIELLRRALNRLESEPVFMVAAYRPGPRAATLPPAHAAPWTFRQLEPLTGDPLRGFVASVLGCDPSLAPPRFLEDLGRTAEGRPQFIVEILRALTARVEPGADWPRRLWLLDPRESPASLERSVTMHLRLVPWPARKLLRSLGVCGHPVSIDLLEHLFPTYPVNAALERLVADGLVERVGKGYRAAGHTLTQRLSAGTAPGNRRKIHRQVAHWLAANEPLADRALAQHARSGDEPDLALRHGLRSARRAAAQGEWSRVEAESSAILSLVSSLPCPPPETYATRQLRADALEQLGRLGEASEESHRLLRDARLAGRPLERARALGRLGRLKRRQGAFAAAEHYAEEALAALPHHTAPEVRARRLIELARCAMDQGDWPRGEHELGVARRLAPAGTETHVSATRGILRLAMARGHYAWALDQALDTLETKPNVTGASKSAMLRQSGECLLRLGRPQSALVHLRRALEHDRQLNNISSESRTQVQLGELSVSRGRHADAHTHFDQACSLARECADRRAAASALRRRAALEQIEGRHGAAWTTLLHAGTIAGAPSGSNEALEIQIALAGLQAELHQWDRVAAELNRLDHAVRSPLPAHAEAEVRGIRARLRAAQSKPPEPLPDATAFPVALVHHARAAAISGHRARLEILFEQLTCRRDVKHPAASISAWTHWLGCTLALARGDLAEATTRVGEALPASEGFPEVRWRILTQAARLELARANPLAGLHFAKIGLQLLREIWQELPGPLAHLYLEDPERQSLRTLASKLRSQATAPPNRCIGDPP